MRLPISVIILTYNESENIERCLKGIYNCMDEILIVDSYSADTTLEIARRYTDKVYQHPFENFAKQRNWAQENLSIKNEWVFHLDADEMISEELISELGKIFSSKIDVDGFMMPRKTIFRGRWIRHGGHYPVYHLRLFKRDKGRCEDRLYDQHYIVNGMVKIIEGDIINIITSDLRLWRQRHKRWALLEAEEVLFSRLSDINSKSTPIQRRRWVRYKIYYKIPLFIRPFIYFFYRYIIWLGFLDGWQGLIFHFWQGLWYRLLVDWNICKLEIGNVYPRH
ncbi:MAG: glycosyltransferase family 2 protein [Candidatus Omnitrophica bacterium]|nr:glycosyltransferase family 2 protein [Candidatus Omnitrophota bacterium]